MILTFKITQSTPQTTDQPLNFSPFKVITMLDYNTLVMIAESALADIGVWHDASTAVSLAEIGLICDSYDEAECMINTAALSFCGESLDFDGIFGALS